MSTSLYHILTCRPPSDELFNVKPTFWSTSAFLYELFVIAACVVCLFLCLSIYLCVCMCFSNACVSVMFTTPRIVPLPTSRGEHQLLTERWTAGARYLLSGWPGAITGKGTARAPPPLRRSDYGWAGRHVRRLRRGGRPRTSHLRLMANWIKSPPGRHCYQRRPPV